MAKPAADYNRGEMEIAEQTATYEGFIGLGKWGSLAMAAMLVFLVLIFCTSAGFLQAAGAAVILLAAGIALLRDKSPAAGR